MLDFSRPNTFRYSRTWRFSRVEHTRTVETRGKCRFGKTTNK